MTLNLLTQVPEGLIMLADSMVSSQRIAGGQLERVSFENARKLFHLGQDHPAAAMINGDGIVGLSPLSQLIREASRALDRQHDVDHGACLEAIEQSISPAYDAFIAERRGAMAKEIQAEPSVLSTINEERSKAGHAPLSRVSDEMIGVEGVSEGEACVPRITPPSFTVIVASDFGKPEATSLTWPAAERETLISEPGGGLWWWGSGAIPIIRLMKGVDFPLLVADGDKNFPNHAATLRYFEEHGGRYQMQSAIEIMPVQQAIYFSEYLANVAAGYDRFKVGPHTVGGDIDVVAIVDRKLKWIHKQRLASSFSESRG